MQTNYYKFFVGGVEVDEPNGATGMHFEKTRNTRFGGILQRSIGRVLGIGEILFEQPLVIGILEEAFRESKLDASVPIRVEQYDGTVIINGEVNFSNFRKMQNGWAVTIRDSGGIEPFLKDVDVEKELTPNQSILLSPYELLEGSTHGLDENLLTYIYKKPLAKTLQHPIPWKASTGKSDAAGQYQSVTNAISPLWTNTTNAVQTVKVEGNVIVTHRSATAKTARLALCVKSSGAVVMDDTQGTILLTSAVTETEIAIMDTLQVPANADVLLFIDSLDTGTDFSFTYNAKSYLYVGLDIELVSSAVSGFYANNLLSSLSLMPLTQTAAVSDYFITDGLRLRAASNSEKGLIASFGQIWDDISKITPLILNWDGSGLQISALESYIRNAGVSLQLFEPIYYELRPCLDILYSGVIAGFNRWQSETPTGGQEENAAARWNTPIRNTESLLNLECQHLTGSKRLIEKIRRKQYEEAGKSTTQDNNDDRQKAIIEFVGNKWNTQLTPSQIVDKWRFWWAASGNLTSGWKEGGATNLPKLSNDAIFTGFEFAGNFNIDGSDWVQIGDVITTYCDNVLRKVWVINATYHPGAAGSGMDSNLEIYGWILND